jgi:CheY-like chemotaxis protein
MEPIQRAARPRILCVDDEPHVVEGLSRQLRRSFDVATAVGGLQGLEVLEREGPFAVVVSDMRMPGMDGAAFLARVHEQCGDTVPVLLTGYADFDAAAAAVNRGRVFRLLMKPCVSEVLVAALEAAARRHAELAAARQRDRELTAELRAAARFRSEFLGNLSHGLRTPLTAILGYAHLLRCGVGGALSPAQHDFVERLGGCGDGLLEFIRAIERVSGVHEEPPGTPDRLDDAPAA